jgi:hypothetical protein
MSTRPVRLTTVGDLCTRCDEAAVWATSVGKSCNLHAVTDHAPTAHPDPARSRIEAAAQIDAARLVTA